MGRTDERDIEHEARYLLTTKKEEVTVRCDLCGRMYVSRPFLCLCRSNVFLQPYHSPSVGS